MENKIIIANLKMNMSFDEVKTYIKYLKDSCNLSNLVICPSNIYILYFVSSGFIVGSQDCSSFEVGAHTGDISASQLKSIGAKYCILGHSERKLYHNESNLETNKKLKLALKNDLKVILCIGEDKEESDSNIIFDIIRIKLDECLDGISDISNIIIAYEPSWAIGSMKVLENERIYDVISYIKNYMQNKYSSHIKVLYGGSVNEHNISKLNEINDVDGFLIGKSSFEHSSLKKIIEVVDSQ